MPYCSSDNYEEFIAYLAKTNFFIESANTPTVMAIGDFNADLSRDQRFGKELLHFTDKEGLLLSDFMYLPHQTTYTFFTDAHDTTSWLDHVVSTHSAHQLIQSMSVNYAAVTSDHLPLSMSVLMPVEDMQNVPHQENTRNPAKQIKWDTLSEHDIEQYRAKTKETLSRVIFNHDLALCDSVKCSDPVHICGIDRLYKDIIAALEEASEDLVQTRSTSQFQIPGWAVMCKDAHLAARETFLLWRQQGSPKDGEVFHDMRRLRAHFMLSLRQCRLYKDKQIADSLANKFLNKDTKDFWKDINSQCSGYGCDVASSVGGVTGTVNVCNMWHDHFKQMLNSSVDFSHKDKVMEEINFCSRRESQLGQMVLVPNILYLFL